MGNDTTRSFSPRIHIYIYRFFTRKVALPRNVIKDSIKAKMEDGVLQLSLDKENEGVEEIKKVEIE